MNNDEYDIDYAKVYRKKGTHYADSNLEPGFQSANLLSDGTNQVCGTPILESFDLDEVRRQERQLQKQEDRSKIEFSLAAAGGTLLITYIWTHGGKEIVASAFNRGKKAAASVFGWSKKRVKIFGEKSEAQAKDQHRADSNSGSDNVDHATWDENSGTEVIGSSPENSVPAMEETFLVSQEQYLALLNLKQNAEQVVKIASFILYNSTIDSTIKYLQKTNQPYICYSSRYLENLKNQTVIQNLQPLSSSLNRTNEKLALSESRTDPEADL